MTLTIHDAFGFVAFASNVVGNLMLTRKNRHGWPVRLGSIVCWGVYGIQTASLPVVANAATFLVINIIGWFSWRHGETP